jgi:hypothetical protein
LVKKGAKKQRLLWASTSVKNPAYSDTLYVDPLIGPDTVSFNSKLPYLICWGHTFLILHRLRFLERFLTTCYPFHT